jgi:hypothetical protein
MAQPKPFERATLETALEMLGEIALSEGKTVEISIYGGSDLMLTFDWRIATRDVDAVFEADKQAVRRLAKLVADRMDLDPDWINDGVKGFLSASDHSAAAKRLYRTYLSEAQPGLRVLLASPEYLFAMKCRAMRIGSIDGNADVEDIAAPAGELGIKTVSEAFEAVAAFYPIDRIEPKTRFGLEEIFARMLPK